MDAALRGIPYAAAYADNIIILSGDNETEHIERIKRVLAVLREYRIHVAPKKCHLGMRRIEFLGHVVSGTGIELMHNKVKAINQLPPPATVSEVRHLIYGNGNLPL